MSTVYIEMEDKNYEYVIVELHKERIYDYINAGESMEEAKERGMQSLRNDYETSKRYCKNIGSDYWKEQFEESKKGLAAGCECMHVDKYRTMRREHLLSGEPQVISEKEFLDMLNVLPPLAWTTMKGVEMFCMGSMLEDSYTWQYAHDLAADKYYKKIVDYKDKKTWLHNILRDQSK